MKLYEIVNISRNPSSSSVYKINEDNNCKYLKSSKYLAGFWSKKDLPEFCFIAQLSTSTDPTLHHITEHQSSTSTAHHRSSTGSHLSAQIPAAT